MTGLWVWWETVKEWFVSSPEPKLTIELVPKGQWGTNLRSRLPKAEWDRLRKAQYQAAGYVCEICGGEGPSHPVECHEVWEYDDDASIQRLTGLIALCPACHGVKHAGRTVMHKGERTVIDQLVRVNGGTRDEARAYLQKCFLQWNRRSHQTWTLDLTWLETPLEPVADDLSFMEDPEWTPGS